MPDSDEWLRVGMLLQEAESEPCMAWAPEPPLSLSDAFSVSAWESIQHLLFSRQEPDSRPGSGR